MALTSGGKLRSVTRHGHDETIGYMHWCPGCNGAHVIYTNQPNGINWRFNGNVEKPTFSPSVLHRDSPDGGRTWKAVCHYFIREGKIDFCSDSAHQFAGKTVELPYWPEHD